MKLLTVSSQALAIAAVVLAWSVWAAPQPGSAPDTQLPDTLQLPEAALFQVFVTNPPHSRRIARGT